MEKKWLMGVLLIIVVIGLVLLGFYVDKLKNPYSDEPSDWVIDKGNGIKEIDVEEVTDGNSFIDGLGSQQWNDGTIDTAFGFEGLYNGEQFIRYYADEFDKKLMTITPKLNENNGIIEGFMIGKIEEDYFITYIFLDEDWKLKVNGETNIVWGTNYENFRSFRFNEISEGVYMDKIQEDKERFDEDFIFHTGTVMVGNFTREQIKLKNSTEGLFVIRIL